MDKKYDRVARHDYYVRNREWCLQVNKEWRLKNREQNLQRQRKFYQENREHILATQKARRLAHPEIYKAYRIKLKLEVFSHYVDGGVRCVRCGFEDLRALTMDHINEDGFERREMEGGGTLLQTWLKNHDYPEGYQVLCMNCQFIKHREYVDEQMAERLKL